MNEPMVNFTLSQSGEISGVTTPYAGATNHYSMIALFSVLITPEFMNATNGQCNLLISHDDGFVIGCSQSGVTWAGPQNLNGQASSALNGYTLIGGTNVNGDVEDTGTITFPAAGTYDFEIDYFQWQNEQTLVVQMNGFSPAPTLGPYNITSCANASAGSTVYAGSFPAGVASKVGQTFNVTGFVTNPKNNGYFVCTVATTTHLTLSNPNGIAESATALATCKSVLSMASAPSWPAWGVGSAPGYPAVTEQSTYPGNGTDSMPPRAVIWRGTIMVLRQILFGNQARILHSQMMLLLIRMVIRKGHTVQVIRVPSLRHGNLR